MWTWTASVPAMVGEHLGWVLAAGLAVGFAVVVVTTLRRSREVGDQRPGTRRRRDGEP